MIALAIGSTSGAFLEDPVKQLGKFAEKDQLGAKKDAAVLALIDVLREDGTFKHYRPGMLLEVFGDRYENIKIKVRAVEALGAIGPETEKGPGAAKAMPHLIKLFINGNTNTKESVVAAMKLIGPVKKGFVSQRDISLLIEALNDNKDPLAAQALGAIGPVAKDDALPVLFETLKLSGPQYLNLRSDAAWALGHIGGGEETVKALIGTINNPREVHNPREYRDVVKACTGALRNLDVPQNKIVKELIEAFNNATDPYLREFILEDLGHFNLEAKNTVPLLIKNLKDLQKPLSIAGAIKALGTLGASGALRPEEKAEAIKALREVANTPIDQFLNGAFFTGYKVSGIKKMAENVANDLEKEQEKGPRR